LDPARNLREQKVQDMWETILRTHDPGERQRGTKLGAYMRRRRSGRSGVDDKLPGALYVLYPDEIVVSFAESFFEALRNVEVLEVRDDEARRAKRSPVWEDFFGAVDTFERILKMHLKVLWVPGEQTLIASRSPILRTPVSVLKQGRPIECRTRDDIREKIPHATPGIYRIYRRNFLLKSHVWRQSIYIGQAIDLRRRLMNHEKSAPSLLQDGLVGTEFSLSPEVQMATEKANIWRWADTPGVESGDGVYKIDVLPARALSTQTNTHWSIEQLDRAEADHIIRARERERAGTGPRVANKTIGINGRKAAPRTAIYVWPAAVDPEGE